MRHAYRTSLDRGASPLGLPDRRSRSPLRRLASASAKAPARPRRSASREGGPIAWLARNARSHLATSISFMRQLLIVIVGLAAAGCAKSDTAQAHSREGT